MVCRPASSEIATKGMPRQILAAISEKRAGQGVPRKSILVRAEVQHVDQQIGDDRELRIVDPPERQRRQHGRHDPGQQHDGAEQALEREVVVQQQRQPEAEREFSEGRDRRIEDAVEHRVPPQRIGQQVLEVLEADEDAAPADRGVGEGEPDAEAQRIGQEHQQQADRRRQANDDQERLVVEQPRQPVRLPLNQTSRRQRRYGHRCVVLLLVIAGAKREAIQTFAAGSHRVSGFAIRRCARSQ